ncbi:hypothetical protein LXL04_020636 [Taraxacum kok-saghyz]
MMSESQSGCGMNGGDDGSGEIMLSGVRVKVVPMRKSVSMNDLSQYVQVQPATHDSSNNSANLDGSTAIAADNGYASADDAVCNQSNGGREHKRGIPWTEEEHKVFLLGLQKVGKGDCRGISRNYVKTLTPTQVASHAQKYFLCRSNLNRRHRRSSLFDITTESVAAIPVEEQKNHEDNNIQPAQQISTLSGFPLMAAFPTTVGPHPSPLPIIEDQMEIKSTRTNVNLNHNHENKSLSLSLNLSLSYDNNRMDTSAFQVISPFNNGNGLISVR